MKHRHLARRTTVRQVLVPGRRKAARHPWALLLWASRNGIPAEDLAKIRTAAGVGRR